MKKIILILLILIPLAPFIRGNGWSITPECYAQRKSLVGGSGVITISDTARHQMPNISCEGLLIKNTSSTDTLLIGGDDLIKANGFQVAPGESMRFYPIDNMKMIYYKLKTGSGSLNYYYFKP